MVDAPVGSRAGGRRALTLRQQESRAGLTLLSPTLLVVLVVVVLPVLWTVMLAFQRLRTARIRAGLFDFDFTLDNLQAVVTSNAFLEGLRNTLLYSVLGTTLSIGL